MTRSKMVLGMLVLAALFGAAQLAADELVLESGKRIAVTDMRIVGGQVYATLPGGQMQAYRVDDVDLEASGLKTEPAKKPQSETRKPASLSSIADRDRGGSRISITDEDVAHVEPSAASTEEAPMSEEAADELIVQVRGHSRSGNQLRVEGLVSNQAGFPVRGVELTATATNAEGEDVGTGSSTVEGEIAPGGSASFTITVQLTGEATGANVQVTGALAAARMERPEPSSEEGGPEEAEGEGAAPPPPEELP